MLRTALWPDFRAAWILHEDEDLIVVDKPAGVPSQSADPSRPDDVVTRLRAYLTTRGEPDPYLGVHQRLDRDTSGIMLFTRRREANAKVAAQFEGRKVEKGYVAAVTGWPARAGATTLRDMLVPAEGGGMRVAPRGKGGKLAITQVRELRRRGPRALLALALETGRTHQARVQLAHAGAPIAGDALYGAGLRERATAVAPRLMLHARSLCLTHPATGKRLRVETPIPAAFEAWLERGDLGLAVYDDDDALDRALALAAERRWGLAHGDTGPRATTAFRLVNEGGDGLPGLAVDVYGEHLVAQLYEPPKPKGAREVPDLWTEARRARVLDRLAACGAAGVYLKVRPRQANVIVDSRREDLAPRAPVRGRAADEPLRILEEGVPYAVRLGDGLSTGIFLDQRANRVRVRELAEGRRVANLFAYTCAFTVAAALGGAAGTVSVDVSAAALERGRENVERVRGAPSGSAGPDSFVAEDVFRWLARVKERFDLVLLDPPSYATTRTRRFVAEDDYPELAAAALRVLEPGGILLACTNHRGIPSARFRRLLQAAVRLSGRQAKQIKDLPDPSDFTSVCGEGSHLKSALITLV